MPGYHIQRVSHFKELWLMIPFGTSEKIKRKTSSLIVETLGTYLLIFMEPSIPALESIRPVQLSQVESIIPRGQKGVRMTACICKRMKTLYLSFCHCKEVPLGHVNPPTTNRCEPCIQTNAKIRGRKNYCRWRQCSSLEVCRVILMHIFTSLEEVLDTPINCQTSFWSCELLR